MNPVENKRNMFKEMAVSAGQRISFKVLPSKIIGLFVILFKVYRSVPVLLFFTSHTPMEFALVHCACVVARWCIVLIER